MKSVARGKSTLSVAEVVQISPHGLWLHVQDAEFFLPYEQFPWFRDATVREIHQVELRHGHHLHWQALDIDLELESLKTPACYPLIFRD